MNKVTMTKEHAAIILAALRSGLSCACSLHCSGAIRDQEEISAAITLMESAFHALEEEEANNES